MLLSTSESTRRERRDDQSPLFDRFFRAASGRKEGNEHRTGVMGQEVEHTYITDCKSTGESLVAKKYASLAVFFCKTFDVNRVGKRNDVTPARVIVEVSERK